MSTKTAAATPDKTAEPIEKDPKALAATNAPHVAETKVRVNRTVKLDGVDSDSASTEDTIEIHAFATVPAMATVGPSVKISRQFQSVGLDIQVSIPCYKEELPQAIEQAYTLAKERILREIPEIQKALNGLVEGSKSAPVQ